MLLGAFFAPRGFPVTLERAMLDPFADDFGPLADLLGELPIRPSPAVVCRWHLRGSNGTRLEVLRIAGKLFTTRAELRRFLQESQRPSGRQTEQQNRIDAELEAAGLLGSIAAKRRPQRSDSSGSGALRPSCPEHRGTTPDPNLKSEI